MTTHAAAGVRLALVHNRLQSIVRAMTNTLVRTGRSGVLNTARDFSCAILTGDHELLAMAESLPIHVMSGPDEMARTMAELHHDLARGDAYIHNSPYHGNSHPADHTLLVPVMDGDGRHRFTVLAKAHQADCGNSAPSTYMAGVEDVYAEGALIFPAVRIQRDYEDVGDIVRMCEVRIRVPEQWRGDYLAMIGSVRIGERQLAELAGELGWDELDRFAHGWFDYSEQQMARAIARLPAGRVEAASAHDPFPGVPDGIPVRAAIEVDPEAGRVLVDLRENGDAVPSGLNLSVACARTAGMVGVFNSIGHGVPPNAGSFRRLDVLLREGSVIGASHPFSCSVATTNLADRVTNAIQRAFAGLTDGVGMAEAGLSQPPAWAVVSGRDPRRDGAAFVNQLLLPAVTGGQAGPFSDGWLTNGHVGNAGLMFRDSVEVDELAHPLLVREQRLLADSEGAGRQRGAPAALVEYGPLDTELRVIFVSDGNLNPALGARGGLPGGTADQFLRRADGTLEQLPPAGDVTLAAGEAIVSISCGGGGYGDPRARDAHAIADDVAEGLVSPTRAREVYGAVVDADGRVDETATAAARH